MHPRTRAAIVWAKTELQRIAIESRTADRADIESLAVRLHEVDTILDAVSRAIRTFGRDAFLPATVTIPRVRA
jgi:hypothetical protein